MKKYRLKEGSPIKKENWGKVLTEEELLKGFNSKQEIIWTIETVICFGLATEVEERIELYSRPRCEGRLDNGHTKIVVGLQKVSGEIFTDQEKELCEKALNGELFTKDDLYQFAQNCLNKCEGEYFSPDLLDIIFKQIKQKK